MRRALALSAILGAGCSSGPGPLSVTGSWGGANAQLVATAGGATFQFKCGAHGQVGAPLALDSGGRFDQPGTYDPVLVAGGPRPAVFSGEVHGSRLGLRVDTGRSVLGPYQLTRGAAARFDVCNF